MLKLNESELNSVKELIGDGRSLKQIARILGRSKTTIYYHFRKLKGKTMKPMILNLQNDELIGEFIGLFAGDGYADRTKQFQHRVYLCFGLKEKLFVDDLIKNVLIPLFGKKPNISQWGSCIYIRYFSKEIYEMINEYLDWNKDSKRKYSVHLRHTSHSLGFVIGFLRGSLDSDGCLSPNKTVFSSVSKQLINNICEFLSRMNIAHTLHVCRTNRGGRRDFYHAYILRKDREKLLTLINPRNKKTYASTGSRTQVYCLEGSSSTVEPSTH